ncbi:GIY-YIG nuclease family protein [Spirosoma sp. BT702]|uniref:GIY-YIG nuclease family protein n=1 Tax=Spirosoma profusum TaxID=2771354 RepID=A0A927AQ99_9BACT|nr:GIY-YIG nuclease family protein [Spirosoma profusum]MBD2699911.1 GIY-YIG nuclease family protein [Spirosoma profusum]
MHYVYILQCADGSYYVGMTNNLERRLAEHEEGFDPNSYTYSRRPIQIRWSESFQSPMAAINVEKQLKGWSRKKKEALIDDNYSLLPKLSKSKPSAK